MRRFAAVVAMVAGLFFIVVPFATSLFDRTEGAEATFDAMRGFVSEPGIYVAKRNYRTVKAGGEQFLNKAVPGLTRRLDLTPKEFNRLLERDFPRVARGAEAIPGYLEFVGPTIVALDTNRDKFESADSLPGAGLPITATPWLFLLLGVLLVGTGWFALVSRERSALVPIAGLGILAVALPLALGNPGKARDARDIGDIARPGLSAEGAKTAEQIVLVLDGMVEEVKFSLVPAIANRLDVTPSEVEAELARDYPATARFLTRWEAIAASETGAKLAAIQLSVVDDFADADETPVLELPWLVIVPGALVALVAGAALLVPDRRRRRSRYS